MTRIFSLPINKTRILISTLYTIEKPVIDNLLSLGVIIGVCFFLVFTLSSSAVSASPIVSPPTTTTEQLQTSRSLHTTGLRGLLSTESRELC